MTMGRIIDSSRATPPLAVVSSPIRQNVTFAVNYSLSETEQFVKSNPIPTANRGARTKDSRQTNLENSPAWINRDVTSLGKIVDPPTAGQNRGDTMTKITFRNNVTDIAENTANKRLPRVPKPRAISRDKNRIKYDMNLVPGARRNKEFVRVYGSGWHTKRDEPRIMQRNRSIEKPAAFSDNAGVVWIPKNRAEWEDCVSEMTAVCTSAAVRRRAVDGNMHKAFHAPLSKDYIRDRVDIDDPMEGYQIRHKGGGWLQGFVLWTNFTTWTHYFKFDSLHEQSGISGTDDRFKVDIDGSLSAELESQPRAGDPLGGGVVFSNMAEISLLGGLGCGEYLLRMALDDIASRGRYKYVVLQATDSSRSFYERFGFVRVGAVSTYGSKDHGVGTEGVSAFEPENITGYRHWTFAHETAHSLEMHGGPSYMMALRLPTSKVLRTVARTSFLTEMKKLVVPEKPKILQLGGASTPAVKKKKVSSLTSPAPNPYLKHVTTPGRRDYRRKRSFGFAIGRDDKPPVTNHSTPSQTLQSNKRRKPNPSNLSVVESRQILMTPPPPGKSLTYAQKQYQSVWLAVPPSNNPGSSNGRKPPRQRESKISTLAPKGDTTKKQKVTNARDPTRKSPRVAGSGPSTNAETLPAKKLVPPVSSNNRDKRLRKQKVLNIQRDPRKVYFYNKVVRPKGSKGNNYFFVLHYDETKSTIRLLPLVRQGELVGKREGRPRYKAVTANHANAPVVSTSDYEIVPAYMVTKTPIVTSETWDILV